MTKNPLTIYKQKLHLPTALWGEALYGVTGWFSRVLYALKIKRGIARPIEVARENNSGDEINSFAFTCSLVALHTKLAQQKGDLSAEAFLEFRCLFPVGDEESQSLRMLFKLAWEDDEPTESHIQRMVNCYPTRHDLFEKVMIGLSRHMLADGKPTKPQLAWLNDIASGFGIHRLHMRPILKQAELPLEARPHALLNIPKRADGNQIKLAYKRFIKRCHPDKNASAALPETRMASERLSRAGNLAYKKLKS